MRPLNICWIDTETTGFSFEINEMISFAGINEAGEVLNVKIHPEYLHTADPKSLVIAGYDPEVWAREAVPSEIAARMIQKFTEGCTLAAHNVDFDKGFLEQLFSRTDVMPLWQRRTIDTVTLAILLQAAGLTKGAKLDDACGYLGLAPRGESHDPLDDARRAKAIWDHFMVLVQKNTK